MDAISDAARRILAHEREVPLPSLLQGVLELVGFRPSEEKLLAELSRDPAIEVNYDGKNGVYYAQMSRTASRKRHPLLHERSSSPPSMIDEYKRKVHKFLLTQKEPVLACLIGSKLGKCPLEEGLEQYLVTNSHMFYCKKGHGGLTVQLKGEAKVFPSDEPLAKRQRRDSPIRDSYRPVSPTGLYGRQPSRERMYDDSFPVHRPRVHSGDTMPSWNGLGGDTYDPIVHRSRRPDEWASHQQSYTQLPHGELDDRYDFQDREAVEEYIPSVPGLHRSSSLGPKGNETMRHPSPDSVSLKQYTIIAIPYDTKVNLNEDTTQYERKVLLEPRTANFGIWVSALEKTVVARECEVGFNPRFQLFTPYEGSISILAIYSDRAPRDAYNGRASLFFGETLQGICGNVYLLQMKRLQEKPNLWELLQYTSERWIEDDTSGFDVHFRTNLSHFAQRHRVEVMRPPCSKIALETYIDKVVAHLRLVEQDSLSGITLKVGKCPNWFPLLDLLDAHPETFLVCSAVDRQFKYAVSLMTHDLHAFESAVTCALRHCDNSSKMSEIERSVGSLPAKQGSLLSFLLSRDFVVDKTGCEPGDAHVSLAQDVVDRGGSVEEFAVAITWLARVRGVLDAAAIEEVFGKCPDDEELKALLVSSDKIALEHSTAGDLIVRSACPLPQMSSTPVTQTSSSTSAPQSTDVEKEPLISLQFEDPDSPLDEESLLRSLLEQAKSKQGGTQAVPSDANVSTAPAANREREGERELLQEDERPTGDRQALVVQKEGFRAGREEEEIESRQESVHNEKRRDRQAESRVDVQLQGSESRRDQYVEDKDIVRDIDRVRVRDGDRERFRDEGGDRWRERVRDRDWDMDERGTRSRAPLERNSRMRDERGSMKRSDDILDGPLCRHYIYIATDRSEIKAARRVLLKQSYVGVGFEGTPLNKECVYVVQLSFAISSTEANVYLLDLLSLHGEDRDEALGLVRDLMGEQSIVKVMHCARRITEALLSLGAHTEPVFDTQVAHSLMATLAGQSDSEVGLNTLLYMHKCPVNTYSALIQEKVDADPEFWQTRPFTSDMVQCAAQKVAFLPKLREQIMMVVRSTVQHAVIRESSRAVKGLDDKIDFFHQVRESLALPVVDTEAMPE